MIIYYVNAYLVTGFALVLCFLHPDASSARDHHHGFRGAAGHPHTRKHTTIQKRQLSVLPNTVSLKEIPISSERLADDERELESNGIPNHRVGVFPNCGNPHKIEVQNHNFSVPRKPKLNQVPILLETGWAFGVAVNGIPFEPLAAEWFEGVRNSKWRYDALSGAITLGVDANYAHVQPGGKYHYHGLPNGLLENLRISNTKHSPIIGWAADGFPMYALYGYTNRQSAVDGVKPYRPSYRIKKGMRPGHHNGPGGKYDGTFNADYEYVKEFGDLDRCNGVFVNTPEFPSGTYAYFLTTDFPIVPRCFMGSPDESFHKRGSGPPPRRLRGGPPPGCRKPFR